jgi:hypothetical protein
MIWTENNDGFRDLDTGKSFTGNSPGVDISGMGYNNGFSCNSIPDGRNKIGKCLPKNRRVSWIKSVCNYWQAGHN